MAKNQITPETNLTPMDKYYTPDITEFHVGFECEIQSQELIAKEWGRVEGAKMLGFDFKPNMDLCFVAHTITATNIQMYFLNPHHLKNDIRVKYLDRGDMEGLGWRATQLKFMHGITDCYQFQDKKYFLSVSGLSANIFDGEDMPEGVDYFSGTIKNKSELRKIMQIVGIVNEQKPTIKT